MKKIKNFMLPEHFNKIYKVEASSTMALARDVTEKLNSLNEVDVLWKQDQEGRIRKGILYMKDNLINTLDSMMEQLKESGFIDRRIKENLNHLDVRVDNLLGIVKEGSTTLDAEIIDARMGDDGELFTSLGKSIRSQIHAFNPIIYLYQGITYNSDNGEITLNTNSKGEVLYNVIERKGSGVVTASYDGKSVKYDTTISRPVAVVLNITDGMCSLKCESTNSYFPLQNDYILFYLYLKRVIPVSLSPSCLFVDGYPYADNPSTYKKYNGSMVALNTKLRVDVENMTITLGGGFYVLPIYKTGILTLEEQTLSFGYSGVIEYLVFDSITKTISIKDRFYKFLNSDFCLGTIYSGKFVPVEIAVDSVDFMNDREDSIKTDSFITMDKMFADLSNTTRKTKIVLGGDSITHGTGGTGFAQNGSEIITIGDKTYKRNTSGYCWANLFKSYIETNYNAEVINNGCTGTNSTWWDSSKSSLIPSDTDIFILTIGTNDRSITDSLSTKEKVLNNFYNKLSSIVDYCHSRGIQIVLCSPIQATANNEDDKIAHMFDINAVIQRIASEHNMQYANIYNEVFYQIIDKNIDINSMLPDGLHPNDAMYKLMFYQYLKAFNLAPHYNVVN